LKELKKARGLLDEANEDLENFYEKVKEWGKPSQRTIDYNRSSPAIAFNVGPESFTEHWDAFNRTLVEIYDGSKVGSEDKP
jgi:hypothetical protein